MYLHNNYVCHFLQDYWKELVIIAIKSKHNYVMCCAHEKKIIYIFIHQVLSLWFMGFVVECLVWAKLKLSKMFRFDLEYLSPSRLYFFEAEAASLFCCVLLSSVSVQPIVSLTLYPPWAGPVSMEWQSVDRKLRKFKMWNIDQSRGQSLDRPSSVTCWLESREETK